MLIFVSHIFVVNPFDFQLALRARVGLVSRPLVNAFKAVNVFAAI